jgi:hypothetical protein
MRWRERSRDSSALTDGQPKEQSSRRFVPTENPLSLSEGGQPVVMLSVSQPSR